MSEAPRADAACPPHEFVNGAQLSCLEKADVEAQLAAFRSGDPAALDRVAPKFSPQRGTFISPKPYLKGVKNSDAYRRYYCEHFLKPHFPKLHCDEPHAPTLSPQTKATSEEDDWLEDLLDSWVSRRQIAYSLDDVPVKGETKLPVWGDDYWALQYGGLSYRYAIGDDYKNYQQAINAYRQPEAWQGLLDADLGLAELSEKTKDWSPAEKYDLAVGDIEFGLTYAEKNAGMDMRKENGDVEDWMGICDGWSAAAVMTDAPMSAVTTIGYGGMKIDWYPHDVRALASLIWAHGDTETNNVGGRCDSKYPQKYQNGRLKEQECFDTNPATFHLALGNLIGRAGKAFIMDATFDYEVWNQPVTGYAFEYYNPLDPKQRSNDWRKVAVPYDAKFKAQDRFQHPLTRGARTTSRNGRVHFNEKGIRAIVGVIATVSYLEETEPVGGPTPAENNVTRQTLTYDLELHQEGGELVPEGGEWHNNAHPDFLWVPRNGSTATTGYDTARVRFDGHSDPRRERGLAKTAHEAAINDDVPLCKVVKKLVDASAGSFSYSCKSAN